MNNKTLILERLQEDLFIKVYVKQILNENFSGKEINDNEFEWDIPEKNKVKKYFQDLKNKYDSLSSDAKNNLKKTAIASLIGLIGLSGGIDKDSSLNTDKEIIKHDIETIANEILPEPIKKIEPIKLSNYEKIIATTLVGEAGGEGVKGMMAVANVLKNRAKAMGENNIAKVALQPKQFSMWNSHTVGNTDIDTIHKMYVTDKYKEDFTIWNLAGKLAKNINRIKDNTGGATSYYNPEIANPDWGEGSTTWVPTKNIGKHTFGIDTSIDWGKLWHKKIEKLKSFGKSLIKKIKK